MSKLGNDKIDNKGVANAPAGLAGTVAVMPPEKRTLKSLLQTGDLGFVPVLFTLVIISIFFEVTTGGVFLHARNISNLTQQIITIGILGLAAILVLLLGEIDLSLATVASMCAGVTAVLSVNHDWNPWLAMLAGILTGTVIGLINGFFVAILRVPSFIVTLAGSIGYAGLLLLILAPQSTIIIRDSTIRALSPTYLNDQLLTLGIGLPLGGLVLYGVAMFYERYNRAKAGLKVKSMPQIVGQLAVTSVVVMGAVILFQSYNGVPMALLIWLGLVILFWLILKKTAFGRHLYAVGGNAEAARRAGINVVGLRIVVFALASTLAAVAGIMLASRSTAVASQISPTLLLNAIAAAVIGGVSLFGGRGSVWAIILGSLVIGSIDNGLDLLNQDTSVVDMVQGAVLLVAVTSDALVRRFNNSKGR